MSMSCHRGVDVPRRHHVFKESKNLIRYNKIMNKKNLLIIDTLSSLWHGDDVPFCRRVMLSSWLLSLLCAANSGGQS